MIVIIVFTGIIYEIRFTDSQKTSANPVAVGEIAVMSMKEIFRKVFKSGSVLCGKCGSFYPFINRDYSLGRYKPAVRIF